MHIFLYKLFVLISPYISLQIFQPLHRYLLHFALGGMGVGVYKEDFKKEIEIYKKFNLDNKSYIFDVGANKGSFSMVIINNFPKSKIIAFEPSPKAFINLKNNLSKFKNVIVENKAVSSRVEKITLYNYKDQEDNANQEHTSMYKEVFEELHHKKPLGFEIQSTTLSTYCKERNISKIKLLKIDTEGNEYQILLGAKKLIEKKRIEIIQFEFNEMNVYSRVFLKDFLALLKDYDVYRITSSGLLKINDYKPVYHELFIYQNIFAVLKK